MAYIASSNITVFPTGNRSELYPESKLTTEFNLTNIINRLVDVNSFVINKEYKTNDIVNPLEFNIRGYYFNLAQAAVDSLTATFNSATAIYGIIKLSTVLSGSYTFLELQNIDSGTTLDVGTQFQGIKFDSSPSAVSGEYSLKLLEKVSGDWRIPDDSKIKFKSVASDNSRTIIIDDGELD